MRSEKMNRSQTTKQLVFNALRLKAKKVLARSDLTVDERSQLEKLISDIPGWQHEPEWRKNEYWMNESRIGAPVPPYSGFGFKGFPERFC